MRRNLCTIVCFLLMMSMLFSYKKSITVVGDAYYPPFTFLDDKGNPQGFVVDIWKLWSKKTGIKVIHKLMRWEDALEMVKLGKADVIDSLFYSEERDRFFDFSKPFSKVSTRIFFHKNLKHIRNLKDIRGYLVGVQIGDYTVAYLKKHMPELSLQFFNSYEEIVKAAKEGVIKVFVADDIPIDYYLIKYDIYDEFNKTKPIYTELIYSAVKEGNTELLKLVNTGLERISKREMESIYRKWFGKPIKLFKTWKYVLWISLIGSIVIISMILWNRSMSIRVEKAARELEKRTEELRKAYKQLKNREKELRETLSKLAKQNWEMQRMIDMFSKLSVSEDVATSLRVLLEVALDLCGIFDKGIVLMKEGTSWKCVAGRNLSDDLISKEFEDIYTPPSGEIMILNIDDKVDIRKIPTPLVKESKIVIGTGFWKMGKPLGAMFLASSEENDIPERVIEIMRSFGSLASSFIYLKTFRESEKRYQTEVIKVMLSVLEARDPYTKGHGERVAIMAREVAERLGWKGEDVERIYWAGILHDIGKIGIPEDILNKPGLLTEEEYRIVQRHPVISAEILERFEHLRELAHIVRYHHERWDGKGYPEGLSGEEIPIESRILAVADAFDAMTSDRPYRKALKLEKAIEEIRKNKGKQFDPDIVKVFIDVILRKDMTA